MKLQRPKISPNIDADLAIGVIDRNVGALTEVQNSVKTTFVFNGMHERTAKGDELVTTVTSTTKRNTIKYQLKRDSIYHILPEYLFHPLDRYAGTEGDKEAFLEKRTAQKKIEEEAKEYFYPFDKVLNDLRIKYQTYLNDSILNNERFIIDFIIGDDAVDKNNPFIRACLPYLLYLRGSRGSDALLTLALKMTFGAQMTGYAVRLMERPVDIDAGSCHMSLDGCIDDLFCGNQYVDWTEVITIGYQTSIASSEDIDRINKELTDFMHFFRRRFLSDSQDIEITFGDYRKIPVLSDNSADGPLFLNYNTQLLVS